MFQSRWGFHPCDFSTYRKLKFLHHVYLKAVRLARAWERWQRKDSHNRVLRRRIRNEQRQVIGYEPPIALPEPRLCSIFTQKVSLKRHVDKRGQPFRKGFLEETVLTDDFGIVGDYASARRPKKNATEVPALRLSLERIEALHEQAQRWLAERHVN